MSSARRLGSGRMNSILSALESRIGTALRSNLTLEQMNVIHVSFHVFPDDLDLENGGRPADKRLYPDLRPGTVTRKSRRRSREASISSGASLALSLLSPFLVVIAVAIKLTSKGPILFKQQRLGQYGARFTFLKFRSMYFQNDREDSPGLRPAAYFGEGRPTAAQTSPEGFTK